MATRLSSGGMPKKMQFDFLLQRRVETALEFPNSPEIIPKIASRLDPASLVDPLNVVRTHHRNPDSQRHLLPGCVDRYCCSCWD